MEVRDGKVLMARAQGCQGADWVQVSVVPATQGDTSKASGDSVAAVKEIYRRLG
ncbi:hypothetical protein [Kitasatospora sp. MMS16-BH015]|uniref:hypothetical protein n=1 Tax=Kitasatospora sp. MMS16-BH015 TaxID=2018025 RepID=UPI00131A51C0|nr:hypothetical protein [Kitasatospora sp. MMS16-BH015]